MAEVSNVSTYNLTTPAILAHPNLFEPRAFGAKGKETGEKKYSANLVLDPADPKQKADIDGMKAMAAAVAKARWPGRDLKTLKFPFTSGDKLIAKRKEKKGTTYSGDADFQTGKVIIAGRSKYEPRLALLEGGKLIDLDGPARAAAKQKFFFGCEILAQVNFVAYDGVGANPDGITCYLNMVVSLNKGTRLSGGASAAETFRGYVGHTSAEDPTGGEQIADDDIPF